LDRYLRILDAPQAVQDAVEAGTLPLTLAEKLVGLGTAQREQVATAIRAGDEPSAVVRQVLGAAPRRFRNATESKDLLVRALKRARGDLARRVGEVRWFSHAEEKALDEGARLIRALLKHARSLRATQE